MLEGAKSFTRVLEFLYIVGQSMEYLVQGRHAHELF